MKILENYPFPSLNPPVILVEGFAAYDGNLKDEVGASHKGIDYVVKVGKKFKSFPVFSCCDGVAFQGKSKMWGKFVIIQKKFSSKLRYDTIYGHLRDINKKIPFLPRDPKRKARGLIIKANIFLGCVGISGNTKRITQLHFEMHEKDLKKGKRKKIDPYGVYDRYSSGKYPQPGKSLRKLKHCFKANFPPFAKM